MLSRSNSTHIKAAINWLKLAQDATADGGVSAWYSLINGWQPSYIETTGYIIGTFLECAEYFNDQELKERALEMADFLIEMQLKSGGYRTHTPQQKKQSQPTVFNTGQDIIGLTDIYQLTKKKKYLDSVLKAADFLCNIQKNDGSWSTYTYGKTSHSYHTRVSWGLLKVYQIVKSNKKYKTKANKYRKSAIKSLDWASAKQLKNGFFLKAELPSLNNSLPFTHTISYVIEGFLASALILKSKHYLNVAKQGAEPLLDYYLKHHFLPGSFDRQWHSIDRYSCLTGNAQLSKVWLELYAQTRSKKYLTGAKLMNEYLKSKQSKGAWSSNTRGAIAGSYPIFGDIIRNKGYSRLAYLNWATKFFIDALLLEEAL